ncbi:MAG: hypothetical protein RXR13_02200 [Sulfolobaceae archaeon]|jgi:hypothetical protein|nr:hypothetical protein [Sulfolobales archaeon]MCQ4406846.1 hypothetical protein [Sulfolobales archaeon]MCQ4447787.1 hypothetical protein [Sulfolobales archaeon]MDT7899011.1 hypothetical protein [Sulfolobales archaeon]MDT7905016.1 hypothetical protein [Sulfolobales archaeon]
MELILENSRSKTNKHAIRTLIFQYQNGNIVEYKDYKVIEKVRPTYVVGEALRIRIPDKGTFVFMRFVKNLYGRVVGRILVLEDGKVVSELKYRKLKLYTLYGKRQHVEIVRTIFQNLKIELKRVNANNAV